MSRDLVLRRAQPTDASALVPLLEQLGYAGAQSFINRRLAQHMEHPDALLLVAEAEGTVLGFISLHFVPQLALAGDFCRISYLCVREDARGLGVGAQLLQHAEDEAMRRGCDRMELHSHARRTAAHRFYFREGYEDSPKYLMKRLR